jgi:hypothetical protein
MASARLPESRNGKGGFVALLDRRGIGAATAANDVHGGGRAFRKAATARQQVKQAVGLKRRRGGGRAVRAAGIGEGRGHQATSSTAGEDARAMGSTDRRAK